MKLLKLIPAAAIALTAFTIFEAKSEQLCAKNSAVATIRAVLQTPSGDSNATSYQRKEGPESLSGSTTCVKLGDLVNVGDSYDFYVRVDPEKGYYTYCVTNAVRSDADSGKTKNYTVTGTGFDINCK